jgi:hypothetical protein
LKSRPRAREKEMRIYVYGSMVCDISGSWNYFTTYGPAIGASFT